jgi:transcriptional regulator with XRE-family HTH domain
MAEAERTERELGRRIRAAREARGASLRSVAQTAGVSESFLSQVERGVASPSVASLRSIAGALDTSIAAFFEEGGEVSGTLVRAGDRRTLSYPGRRIEDMLLTPRTSKHLQVIWSQVGPNSGSDEPYTHESDEECVVVMRGRLHVWVDGERFEMEEGDSLVFESRKPHRSWNPTDDEVEVLWILTPPSF